MAIDRDNTNGRKHGWFLWGNWWRSTDQTNRNNTNPNNTTPTWHTKPTKPTFHTSFPPPTSYTPHHHHRCSRACEARHMDASRSLVRWTSWNLLPQRLDVVGFPVVWSWLVGCFLFIKPLPLTVGYGISHEKTSWKGKKWLCRAWTLDIGMKMKGVRDGWMLPRSYSRLFFFSSRCNRSIQGCDMLDTNFHGMSRYVQPLSFTPWIMLGLRDQTHGTVAWCERCELGDAKCRTSKWEAQEQNHPIRDNAFHGIL